MKFYALLFTSMMVVTPLVHAEWATTTSDDIFIQGKRAILLGRLSDAKTLLIFDCTSKMPPTSMGLKWRNPTRLTEIGTDLLVKIDSHAPMKFKGEFQPRNDSMVEIEVNDRSAVTELLKELKEAKSKIQVGYAVPQNDFRTSFLDDIFSPIAVTNTFIKACYIQF